MQPARRNKRTLFILFCLPLTLFVLATVLYYLADARLIDLGTANKGTLIIPPLSMTELTLTNQQGDPFDYTAEPLWTLLVIGGKQCNDVCERMLYLIRQTHAALGKHVRQVRRIYLSIDHNAYSDSDNVPLRSIAELQQQYPDVLVLRGSMEALQTLFAESAIDPLQSHRFFLVDPQGWMMMTYQVGETSQTVPDQTTLNSVGKDALKDMKRLLR